MKAVRITAPQLSAVAEIDEPILGDDDIEIAVAYVGYCGSDLNSYRGLNPLVSYPRVPGHEIAGTIARTSPAVAGLKVGQRVTVMPYFNCGSCRACRTGRPNACVNNQTMGVQREGAMTERVVVPASKVIAVDGVDLQTLALVEPCAVGFHAVRRGEVSASDTVLIMGCGMVGLGALIGARRTGARIIAFDLSDEKLVTARTLGAAATINPGRADWKQQLAAIVPDGPDVVIEAVGAEATFLQAVDVVATCGRVVYIGYAKGPIAYDTKQFITKELDIRGSRNALMGDFRDVIDELRAHPETAEHVISRIVQIADAPVALADWHRDPGGYTKILVQI